ncbi:MAG: copper resistance protein CopC [Chloroflexi bacterium]|nr:copper resistance protein CopC [Chloroflexota bacterium]
MTRRIFVGTALVVAIALGQALVFAHAGYDHSVPDRDEVVQAAPDHIDVYFTQEVFKQAGANYVRVFDEADVQVSDGDGVVDDDDRTHISTAFPSTLTPGRYIVRWATLSDEDGDDDSGAFCFYVAVEPTVAQQVECAELAGEEDASPTPGATATGGATQASPVATATPADGGGNDGGGGLNGALIGGVIGGVAAVAVVGAGLVLWQRRSKA